MKKYKVIRNNCCDFELGEIVELDDKKAASLINKVELVEEEKKESPKRSSKKKEVPVTEDKETV